MAEERLIDDDEDKDRKFRIRKNEDGEDELIILTGEDETEEESDGFLVPELESDDEEAAVLTPEQLAERERVRREEEERRARIAAENVARAEGYLAEKDYDNALYVLSLAEEAEPSNGEAAALVMHAVTRGFTDFSRLDACTEAAEKVRARCSAEQRKELIERARPLCEEIALTRDKADELAKENEKRRAERQEVFVARRKKAARNFLITALPFIAFLAAAIAFSTVMFAKQDGSNLIITIVLGVVAAIFLIASLFTAHKLWEAERNLRLNGKNSSTKLGREYEQTMQKLKDLSDVYEALGGNL